MVYVALFFYLQYQWVTGPTSYTLAVIYGVSMALIGMNVQHDANHGAASRRVWVNDILGLGADFIGGCKWLWMEKHWTVSFLMLYPLWSSRWLLYQDTSYILGSISSTTLTQITSLVIRMGSVPSR